MTKLKVLKPVCGLALLLAVVSIASAQWQNGPTSDFRFTRFDGEYFPGTGMVYFMGGRLSDGNTDGTIWSFDPATGTYASTGVTMPTPISNYDMCLLRDDYNPSAGDTWGLYVIGGRMNDGNNTTAVQAYYPISNTVRTVTSDPFPGRISGNIYAALGAVTCNNMIFVFGGFYPTTYAVTGQTWLYDPTQSEGTRWTQLADLNHGRGYIAAAVVDSMVYAIGGDTAYGTSLYAEQFCEVLNGNDPFTSWVNIANLPSIGGETRVFGFNSDSPYEYAGELIEAGQGQWPSEVATSYSYDVETNVWSSFSSLIQARRNHAGALIPGTPGPTGVPGMWIWGGRAEVDTNVFRSSEFVLLHPTGIRGSTETRLSRHLAVSPMPVAGDARINYELPRPGHVAITLYDVTGRPVDVLSGTDAGAGRHTLGFDARGYGSGIYLLRFDNEGYTETVKLVIE